MPDKMILGNTEFVFDRKLGFHVGEWTVWDRKAKILLEFQSTEGNIGDIVLEKVNWVNDHKDTIIRAFWEENDDCIDAVNEMIEDGTLEADGKISEEEFVKALFVNNVTVFVNGKRFVKGVFNIKNMISHSTSSITSQAICLNKIEWSLNRRN